MVGSLPVALNGEGLDARVILPKYNLISFSYKQKMQHLCHFNVLMGSQLVYCGIDSLVENGVTYYFVDNLAMFGGESIYTGDEQEGFKFAFFCRCVLECMKHLDYFPDVLHCNDWQTGLIPCLKAAQYSDDERYKAIKTVYTIHNLRYQGLFGPDRMNRVLGLDWSHFTPDGLEFYGLMSFMKGGIVYSDRVTTVSPNYAEEIRTEYYGEHLDGLLRHRQKVLCGILNGIDTTTYDPWQDKYFEPHFSKTAPAKKKLVKRQLQAQMGLEARDAVPVIAMITRLTPQKGLDLVERVLEDIMKMDVQLVFLGKGDEHYERLLCNAQNRYKGRIATRIELNEGLAHLIYAGSDMFLMPSQFEPCGLSQMIALRYGCIPIVRETGGLKDSITPYNMYTDDGNGFSFRNYNAHEMLSALETAVKYYYDDKEMWKRLVRRAMRADFSWSASAKAYKQLYLSIQ